MARVSIQEHIMDETNHEMEPVNVSNKQRKNTLTVGSMKTDHVDTEVCMSDYFSEGVLGFHSCYSLYVNFKARILFVLKDLSL